MPLTKSAVIPGDDGFVFLPGNLLSPVFSEVSYRKEGQDLEIRFCIRLLPGAEWNSVVAIDASESMRSLFGKSLSGDVPLEVQEGYHQRNLVFDEVREGNLLRFYKPEAFEDAIAKRYLNWSMNEVEPKAQELLEFLARQIDARGACNLMYWGCDNKPGWVDLGEIRGEDCQKVAIDGPDPFSFGTGTKLLPVIQFLAAQFADVPNTMVVILTDGRFSDAEDVKTFCIGLACLIKAKQRNFMKFVAIGMGPDIDRKTLDDLDGNELAPGLDLWETALADEMKNPGEIFRGIVSEEQIVAANALICDEDGNIVKKFEGGLPAKVSFRMPAGCTSFSLEIPPNPRKTQQSLLLPFRKTLY